jgi:hypothetical protein
VTGVVGLGLTGVGVELFRRVDRAVLVEAVDTGVEAGDLTTAEVVTAAMPFVDWLAAGLAVTGIVLTAGTVVFLIGRRRTRRRVAREGGTTATRWACAAYGAAVAAVLQFIPGGAAVGGGVAASLSDTESDIRAGARSGLLGAAVTLPLLAGVTAGLVAGAGAVGDAGFPLLLVAAGVAVSELVLLALTTATAALGGYLAGRYF